MPDENIIKRLAFIRFMYKTGLQQSERPEPLSAASILAFHDACELFLQLVCTVKSISTKKRENVKFMEYFDVIAKEAKMTLAQSGMYNLNKARVQLKHYGLVPSKFEIESAAHDITNFFSENIRLVFNLEFQSISMSQFVQYEPARNNLEQAIKLIEEHN